jgi:hypothetical protein
LWVLLQTRLVPWQKSLPCRLGAPFVQAAASSNNARDKIALIKVPPLHTHAATAHTAPAHSFSAPFLSVVARHAALTGGARLAAGRIVGAGCEDQQQERRQQLENSHGGSFVHAGRFMSV